MSFHIPLTDSYLCHNCDAVIWAPDGRQCEECGMLLVPVKALYEHHVVKVRARLTRHGVDAKTPERRTQAQSGNITSIQLAAFLTEWRAA